MHPEPKHVNDAARSLNRRRRSIDARACVHAIATRAHHAWSIHVPNFGALRLVKEVRCATTRELSFRAPQDPNGISEPPMPTQICAALKLAARCVDRVDVFWIDLNRAIGHTVLVAAWSAGRVERHAHPAASSAGDNEEEE